MIVRVPEFKSSISFVSARVQTGYFSSAPFAARKLQERGARGEALAETRIAPPRSVAGNAKR